MKINSFVVFFLFLFVLITKMVIADDEAKITISDLKQIKGKFSVAEDSGASIISVNKSYVPSRAIRTRKGQKHSKSIKLVEELINSDPLLIELKKTDPNSYKDSVDVSLKHLDKQVIIQDYIDGKISKRKAHSKLKPFVVSEVGSMEEISNRAVQNITMLEEEVARLENQILREKKLKSNPRLIIDQKIDEYLNINRD